MATDGTPGDEPVYSCEHADHDVASPSRCRMCRDWARHRPVSRRLSLEELVPPPDRRCGSPVRRWAVGITTAPRRRPTLEACLDGVVRAGWEAPRLFLDGTSRVPPRYAHLPMTWREDGVGAWPSWYLALAELVLQQPDADAYLMLQDDVVLHDRESLRGYLERVLWPGDRPGLVSLFYTGPDTTPGWHRDEAWHWGAQGFVLSPALARALLADPGAMQALLNSSADHHIPIPSVLYAWARRHRIDTWYATPSLSQHIGNASAIWENAALTSGRRAPWFSGDLEDAFALEEGLADFPERAFACDASDLDAYRRRVGRGRERMRESSVVFCGLCRDARHFLPRLAARVERLGGMFRDYRVVLVEDQSTDATLEFLDDWRASNPRVDVLGGAPDVPRHARARGAARAGWMAGCRNRYRDRVAAEYADFDHAIVIDANLAGGWSFEGVAHTFGGDDWDFVGSNGLARRPAAGPDAPRYRHHDIRAFRPAAGTAACDLVDHADLHLRRGMPMLPVESCFGGLGVYRMACLLACSYGGGDCEHVVFHDRMRRSGLGRLYLNPSQIVLHSPA